MSLILKVEDLSKKYKIGTSGTGSIKKDLHRWWSTSIMKKEDPFFKDLSHEGNPSFNKNNLWALKDINFEVKQGELIGIVGSNGSGKSTLLKILSRIIKPTSGRVFGKGKVSSLLEIGTGFNAELTGRENIYMSGYFLGMKRNEVRQRFDEIVEFSGVERFIDTPVKRYSTGMYMRLAFSVSAHLEPDILIVDEVLAVGDAEFQAKCIAKMQSASKEKGRTILLVSHDSMTIANLCCRVIWMESGRIVEMGETIPVINKYIANLQQTTIEAAHKNSLGPGRNDLISIKSIEIFSGEKIPITVGTPINIHIEFENHIEEGHLKISFKLATGDDICVFDMGTQSIEAEGKNMVLNIVIPGNLLNDRAYTISLKVLKDVFGLVKEFKNCAEFEVQDLRLGMNYYGSWSGIIRPKIEMGFYTKEGQNIITDKWGINQRLCH